MAPSGDVTYAFNPSVLQDAIDTIATTGVEIADLVEALGKGTAVKLSGWDDGGRVEYNGLQDTWIQRGTDMSEDAGIFGKKLADIHTLYTETENRQVRLFGG
ncbi:WXG100 family type VII secretion target [Streptomyces griseoruber]|uniref:WXG100 family type VII secretion target n=1 Tax=Streptomyces griseoruber TaxID=1943 RepID=UPI0037B3D53C